MRAISRLLIGGSPEYKKRSRDIDAIVREQSIADQNAGRIILCYDFFNAAVLPAIAREKAFRKIFGPNTQKIAAQYTRNIHYRKIPYEAVEYGRLPEGAREQIKKTVKDAINYMVEISAGEDITPDIIAAGLSSVGIFPKEDENGEELSCRNIAEIIDSDEDMEIAVAKIMREVEFPVLPLGWMVRVMDEAGKGLFVSGVDRYFLSSDLRDELPHQLEFWKSVNKLEDFTYLLDRPNIFPPSKPLKKPEKKEWAPGWIPGVPQPT